MSSLTVRFCSVCSKMLYFSLSCTCIIYGGLYIIFLVVLYYYDVQVVHELCTDVWLGEITVYLGKECLFELAPP